MGLIRKVVGARLAGVEDELPIARPVFLNLEGLVVLRGVNHHIEISISL